jgi:cytochrome c biogenesis protein CcmG/thiol:disulfide interchange protein DsbE
MTAQGKNAVSHSADDRVTASASTRLLVALPLIGFLGLAALLYVGLGAPGLSFVSPSLSDLVQRLYVRLGGGDPSQIPSPLIGKRVPTFSLPTLSLGADAAPNVLTDAYLRQGRVTLVNIFASWCAPCHDEHPQLMRLAGDKTLAALGVRVVGIAYKDATENTRQFLANEGNPYAVVGTDAPGRVAIDWGVYGVPETFIVKGDGTIAYKFIGPMGQADIDTVILPEIGKIVR